MIKVGKDTEQYNLTLEIDFKGDVDITTLLRIAEDLNDARMVFIRRFTEILRSQTITKES